MASGRWGPVGAGRRAVLACADGGFAGRQQALCRAPAGSFVCTCGRRPFRAVRRWGCRFALVCGWWQVTRGGPSGCRASGCCVACAVCRSSARRGAGRRVVLPYADAGFAGRRQALRRPAAAELREVWRRRPVACGGRVMEPGSGRWGPRSALPAAGPGRSVGGPVGRAASGLWWWEGRLPVAGAVRVAGGVAVRGAGRGYLRPPISPEGVASAAGPKRWARVFAGGEVAGSFTRAGEGRWAGRPVAGCS